LLNITALTIFLISISACSLKTALAIEEHPKKSIDWDGEGLIFEPMEGNREEILAKHANERSQPAVMFSPPVEVGGDSLNVIDDYEDDLASIEVYRNDSLEMSIEASIISPINNFRGVWVVDEHGFFEVAHVEEKPVDPMLPLMFGVRYIRMGSFKIKKRDLTRPSTSKY